MNTNNKGYMHQSLIKILMIALLPVLCKIKAYSQPLAEMSVDLSQIDGMDITPDNLHLYTIFSTYNRVVTSEIRGRIVYRKSSVMLEFKYRYDVQPGLNRIDLSFIHPEYKYSSSSLRELFQEYKKLPQGIYEYCVTIEPDIHNLEIPRQEFSQCLLQKTEDLFFINLVDPENDAKIYEYNPMLSWMVSFPFSSELKYRIRVCEIREGQTALTAITRNNPVYEEGNLYNTGMMYPVYARPLVKWQPYAWTVDAYYKDLLLGGAEPWKFTIIEDSVVTGTIPREISYYDFTKERLETRIFALDTLKLKYHNHYSSDHFSGAFYNAGDNTMVENAGVNIDCKEGVNYLDIDIKKLNKFRHKKDYVLVLTNTKGKTYSVPFTYIDREKL